MSAPNPQLLAPGGGAPIPTPIDLGRPLAGIPGTAVSFEVWNANGDPTADIASGLALLVFDGPHGGPVGVGRATSEGWVQIRCVGTVGSGITPQATAWRAVSALSPFELDDIPANSARQLEIRLFPPASATTDDLDFELVLEYSAPSTATSAGFPEASLRGVWSGLGDPLASFVVRGGELAAHGTPDNGFAVGEVQWLLAGVPHAAIAQDVSLNADGADGTLTSGQAYIATISLDDSGVVVTKGNRVSAPPQPSARVPAPAGTVLLGYVVRDTGTIGSTDVDSSVARRGRFALTGTGLQRTISGGRALVDGAVARPFAPTVLTLPPSESAARIWINGSGLFSVTATGAAPAEDRAVLLYTAATDTSDIISLRDERRTLGREDRIVFPFDTTLAVAQTVVRTWAEARDALVRIPRSVAVALFDEGIGLISGATTFEIEFWDGAAWTTLFTSSGTIDRRPSVAFGALSNYDALPEVLVIPAGARVRARVTAIPVGTTPPSGAEVVLFLEEP